MQGALHNKENANGSTSPDSEQLFQESQHAKNFCLYAQREFFIEWLNQYTPAHCLLRSPQNKQLVLKTSRSFIRAPAKPNFKSTRKTASCMQRVLCELRFGEL
jgi:hypothetical protein